MCPGNRDVELYNFAEDVAKRKNIVDQHPANVAKLEKLMKQERSLSKLFPLRPLDASARKPKKK